VRIGPPAEESFVLSVHTPDPPRLSSAQPTLFDSENAGSDEPSEPFERLVSLRLYGAVSAAHGAANEALVDANGLEPGTCPPPSASASSASPWETS
jgi:hypothetical protein